MASSGVSDEFSVVPKIMTPHQTKSSVSFRPKSSLSRRLKIAVLLFLVHRLGIIHRWESRPGTGISSGPRTGISSTDHCTYNTLDGTVQDLSRDDENRSVARRSSDLVSKNSA
eukprot:scaffold10077_cov160-Amphora_coffeaeformis.AAC.1